MSTNKQKRSWHNSLFGWKKSEVTSGRELELIPQQAVHFEKMSIINARFPVAAKHVQQLLPNKKFSLMTNGSGTAELFLVGMQIRQAEGMTAFNQFSIGTLVHCLTDNPDNEMRGYFHIYTPVTTHQAYKVGKRNYGFPTLMADIQFEETAVSTTCHLSADDAHILSLTIKKQETQPDLWAYTNLTNQHGQIRQSYFQAKGDVIASERSSHVHCELGVHPLADRLRELRIGSISLGHRFSSEAEALLHQSRRVR